VPNAIIHIENISKRYLLDHKIARRGRSGTLRDAITEGVQGLGKKLTFAKGQETYTREEFWALKNVSFDIYQGDRIGIIGGNGAGKSTLLKILSRIVTPTEGGLRIKGRVASLLEVGTGFHPELTGRENIYLNGAILGMSRHEIRRKFDEIVDFANVSRFLDTPVKRFSSGMYVRLAFAVAAHLEPEILIVDEVLAVGDAQFQKKCLGKMQEVSQDGGRTVIFVSHDMEAVQRLCSKCALLHQGELVTVESTSQVISKYMSTNSLEASPNKWIDLNRVHRIDSKECKFKAIKYSSLNPDSNYMPYPEGPLEFSFEIVNLGESRMISSLAVNLFDKFGTKLIHADTIMIGQSVFLQKGTNILKLTIDQLFLNPGSYVLGLWLGEHVQGGAEDLMDSVFELEVVESPYHKPVNRHLEDGFVTCKVKLLECVPEQSEILN
jgi:lipopolysaccharide transport system ATP-binding protein